MAGYYFMVFAPLSTPLPQSSAFAIVDVSCNCSFIDTVDVTTVYVGIKVNVMTGMVSFSRVDVTNDSKYSKFALTAHIHAC
jgi:hypothetical protein